MKERNQDPTGLTDTGNLGSYVAHPPLWSWAPSLALWLLCKEFSARIPSSGCGCRRVAAVHNLRDTTYTADIVNILCNPTPLNLPVNGCPGNPWLWSAADKKHPLGTVHEQTRAPRGGTGQRWCFEVALSSLTRVMCNHTECIRQKRFGHQIKNWISLLRTVLPKPGRPCLNKE